MQLRTSRMAKQPWLDKIAKREDLYLGIVEKSITKTFNECFPFMSGFVDQLHSEVVKERPSIKYLPGDDADYKSALKITALWEKQSKSSLPFAKWGLKDRWATKYAIFSGLATYKVYGESYPSFKVNFDAIDYRDFHWEPGGGGHLEMHLFCGQEGVFRTDNELIGLMKDEYIDPVQLAKLISNTHADDYKDNENQYNDRLRRQRQLGLDPTTNNYTGQKIQKLTEWYLTYDGVRWQLLFDERSALWLRVKPLREIFVGIEEMGGEALWPYVCWHTHEDGTAFASKAPVDDAYPIAITVNTLLNQELYNREKQNHGQKIVDPDIITDLEALTNSRPDGIIIGETKNGKSIKDGIYEFRNGPINGSLDLVQYLDQFHGQKNASTPGSMGAAEKDKKVGVFFGEMEQIKKRLSVHNESKREAYEEIGMRFMLAADKHLNRKEAVRIMGAKGYEWVELEGKDIRERRRPFDVVIRGGSEEEQMNALESQRKLEGLKNTQTVNPRWKDEQILILSGYDDAEMKEAFSMLSYADKELMSEAAEAIEEILRGGKPPLNRGATESYVQKLIDAADALDDAKMAINILDFANAHAQIAAENEARAALRMRQELMIRAAQAGTGGEPLAEKPQPSGATVTA